MSNLSSAGSEAEEGELEDELASDGTGAGASSEADIDRLMWGIGKDADTGPNDKAGEGGELNYAAMHKEVRPACSASAIPTAMYPDARSLQSNEELDSLFDEDSGVPPTLTRKRVRSFNDQGPPAKRAAPRDPIFVHDSSSDEAPVASSSTVQNRPRLSNTTPKSRLVVAGRNRPIISNASQQSRQNYSIIEAIELVEQKFRIEVQTIRRLHTNRTKMNPQVCPSLHPR